MYYHHTGHIGGIKEATFEEMIARRPERVIEIAVKGMLPKGPLGRAMYRKLKVYAEIYIVCICCNHTSWNHHTLLFKRC